GGPVAVAVEQRAADAAVQHPRERLVMTLGRPRRDERVALDEAPDAQALHVRGAAAEADAARREAFLDRARIELIGVRSNHARLAVVTAFAAGIRSLRTCASSAERAVELVG